METTAWYIVVPIHMTIQGDVSLSTLKTEPKTSINVG